MPKIRDNALVWGASGDFSKQFVFKQRGNKTFIAKMPTFKKDAVPTAGQIRVRKVFFNAAAYAKGVVSDPFLKNQYRLKAKPGESAFNVAFRDYIKPPLVELVKTDSYTGLPGSTLVVAAMDDFRVKEVMVSIRTATGVLLEEGPAFMDPLQLNEWVYTAAMLNEGLPGTLITAIAKDLPGNKTVLQITL